MNIKQEILNTPLPIHGNKYGVIPHSLFIDTVQEKLYNKGYEIIDENYYANKNCNVISGRFQISSNQDLDITPSIFFENSYDKTKSASLMIGGVVLICKNGMLGNIVRYKRKHLGNAFTDFLSTLEEGILQIENEFEKLVVVKDEMKNIEVNKSTVHKLIADMYLEEGLIKETQLAILKRELKQSENFKGNSLWDLYNNITESFKSNNSKEYTSQHSKFHGYISDNFNLSYKPNLYNSLILN